MQAHYHNNIIWTIDDFLSPHECEDLMILSEHQGYEEAKVSLPSGAKMIKGIRNNYRLMHEDPAMATLYWNKLQEFCPARLENAEAIGLNPLFRFYKYDASQRFKRHIDGRFQLDESTESRITFMIYLNDDFEGGETKFDDLTIVPKKGTALCFIHEQKHEGCPVTEGSKYVLRTDVMYRKTPSNQV